MNERIYLCLAHMSGEEQKYIQEAFDTNWVVPLGPNVNGFEEDLKSFLGDGEGKHVVALSAGTAALHLANVLLGIGPGDEVICQSFTFAASANPIVYQGATPVFVDSEPETWNMSPVLLRKAIEDRISKTGRKPKAIVVVEMYGMPCQMSEILGVASEYGIPVVEDAAEAFGAKYKGHRCGTYGHFGALSFNGNKMITTSGGGALVCPDEDSKQRAMFYATQAREPFPYYQHEKIGYNYRMSNICAGIGRGQMTVAEEHIRHHQWVNKVYCEAFMPSCGATVMPTAEHKVVVHTEPSADMEASHWLTTILLHDSIAPLALQKHLDEKNIESRPLWKPMHLQPVYAECPAYVDGTSEKLFQHGLCLPSGPYVKEPELERIITAIKEFVG